MLKLRNFKKIYLNIKIKKYLNLKVFLLNFYFYYFLKWMKIYL